MELIILWGEKGVPPGRGERTPTTQREGERICFAKRNGEGIRGGKKGVSFLRGGGGIRGLTRMGGGLILYQSITQWKEETDGVWGGWLLLRRGGE